MASWDHVYVDDMSTWIGLDDAADGLHLNIQTGDDQPDVLVRIGDLDDVRKLRLALARYERSETKAKAARDRQRK